MKVEYTGRQTTINKKQKAQAEEGLARIGKLVGRAATAHVILTEDKYRMIAEITVVSRGHSLVATCESADMNTALHDALAKVEKQALKLKDKFTTQKRHPKDDKNETNLAASEAASANGSAPKSTSAKGSAKKVAAKAGAARKAASMVVHSFPSGTMVVEPHVVRSIDSAAMRPMTFEEAVKEAACRDRDVFVFRDHVGQVMILHRQRDGKMELIEVP